MPQIILASQSKQRLILMELLGIPFEVIPAGIDEKSINGENFSDKAKNIALAKAQKVAESHPNSIIVAADTFTCIGDRILEKPENLEEAREMLRLLSGQTSYSYTGFAYLEPGENEDVISVITKVKFRELLDSEIKIYVESNPVMTWAAAYSAAYAGGSALIHSIEGSLTGFTHGFPMEELMPRLQKSGVFNN